MSAKGEDMSAKGEDILDMNRTFFLDAMPSDISNSYPTVHIQCIPK